MSQMNTLVQKLMLVAAANWPNRNQDAEQAIIDIGERITVLVRQGVTTDGAQHKQWALEEIADVLGVTLPDHETGIAP